MNVLHISGARSWGGNEQQLLYLTEELYQKGINQFLFGYENSILSKRLQNDAVKQILIPYVKPYKKSYRKSLKNILDTNEIDIIHLHTSDAVTGYVITDLLFNLDVKTVFSKKGISRKTSFLSKYKYNYKNIHKIICVSKVVENHFKEVLYKSRHHKLCVVYDAVRLQAEGDCKVTFVDLKASLNLSDKIFLIGNIANHTDAKDLETLIRTLHHLIYELKITNVYLAQIGSFSKRTEELKALVKQLHLDSYITFFGFKQDASGFMPQFNMFLMTSQREGGPTTVLEAFSQKIPVVSTKVGVVVEAIEDGINGFSTNVGNYKKLAKKIKRLWSNNELQQTFATRSYSKFQKNFTVEQLGKETLKVYQEVLSS